jgi:hypothetical protein
MANPTIYDDVTGNANGCNSIAQIQVACDCIDYICQDITVQLDENGLAHVVVSDIDNNTTDACEFISLGLTNNSFTCTNVGTNNTLTITGTDIYQNAFFCEPHVTVEDNIPPTPFCMSATVQLDLFGDGILTASMIDAGSSDACGSVTLNVSASTFDCSQLGITQNITLLVSDLNGNTSSCSAIVTIEDNVPPTALCHPYTVQLDANGIGYVKTSDIDAGSSVGCGMMFLSVDPNSFDCSYAGMTESVTLTVEDAEGNTTSCSTTVTIERNNALNCQWTGQADSDWFNPLNWSNACLPGEIDKITIPASTPHMPHLASNSTKFNNLTVDQNAHLIIDGTMEIISDQGLAVTNNGIISVNGQLFFGGGNFINNGVIMGSGEILGL